MGAFIGCLIIAAVLFLLGLAVEIGLKRIAGDVESAIERGLRKIAEEIRELKP